MGLITSISALLLLIPAAIASTCIHGRTYCYESLDEEGKYNARREVEFMNLKALKQERPAEGYKLVEDFLYKCIGHNIASVVDIAQECDRGYCHQNAGRQRFTLWPVDQCVDSLDVIQQRDGDRAEVKTRLEKKKRKWFKKFGHLSDEIKASTWL